MISLLLGHVQFAQLKHRQSKDQEIQDDVDNGMDCRPDIEVQACALCFTVPLRPRVGDGTALEDEEKGEDGALNEGDCQERVCDATEAVGWEEADVEQEEGHFGHGNSSDIKDTADVEYLYPSLLDDVNRRRQGNIPGWQT